MVRRSKLPLRREIFQRPPEVGGAMESDISGGESHVEKHDLGKKTSSKPANTDSSAAQRGHEIRLSFREIRQDAKKGIVFGEVYVPFEPEVGKVYPIEEIQAKVDSWGTFMRASTIEDLAQRFLQFRGYIDRQHDRSTLAGQVVQSFIARIGDPEFTPGAWVMAVKVCPEIWPDVVAGKLTGFSIDVLAARQQHQVVVSGTGVVPDLNGVTEAPYPAQERQVNGETSLRLDELVSVTPFFVSLVDKAAINREFEQRARATANKEPEMKTPNTTTAETTAPTEAPAPPPSPAADARSIGPLSLAPASPDTRAVKPVKGAPKRTRASRQPKRGEKRFSSDMGDGVIDFAQQWAVEDITDEVCEANWLLHDTLDSILYNAASFADKSAMFDAMVKALNDYAAAMQQTMLQPAVDGEQRSQNLPEHTGRKNAVFHSVPETVVLRSRYSGARVEVRIGAKIAADRLEKIKAAHSKLDEILKEVEGSVDMPTEENEPNKGLETSETETIADPNAGSDIFGENSKPAPKPVSTPTDEVKDPSQSGPMPGKVLDTDRGEGAQPSISEGTGAQTGGTPLEQVAKLVNALIAKIDELSAKVDALDGNASPDQQANMDAGEDEPRTANQPAAVGDSTMGSLKEKTQCADASDDARPTEPNPNNQPVEEGTVPSTTDPSKKGGVTARSKPAMFRQAPWAAPCARGAPIAEDPAAVLAPAAPVDEARRDISALAEAAPPKVDPQLAEILATLRSVEKRFDGLDERVAKVEKRRRPSSQPGDAPMVTEVASETRSPVPGINGGPSDGKDVFRGAIFGRRPSGK